MTTTQNTPKGIAGQLGTPTNLALASLYKQAIASEEAVGLRPDQAHLLETLTHLRPATGGPLLVALHDGTGRYQITELGQATARQFLYGVK